MYAKKIIKFSKKYGADYIKLQTYSPETITLNSTASGAEAFNRVGTTEYAGGSTNHIQVICLDDSASTPVFHYTINKVTSDDTP